jgi:hypothetical protein
MSRSSATADGLTFDIALYPCLTDTAAQVRRVTWDEFAEAVGTHEEREHRDGPLFSVVTFKDGPATRANDNVERVNLAVFEVDHEEPHWGLLDGLEYVAYTAHSHGGAGGDDPRENCPHWRIVLLLARAVLRTDWGGILEEGPILALPACRRGVQGREPGVLLAVLQARRPAGDTPGDRPTARPG